MTTATATRPNCEYRLWRDGAYRECGRTVAVAHWWDEAGDFHSACPSHIGERQNLYPVADAPMPVFLHEDPAFQQDPIDMARWESERLSFTDAGFTESELRLMDGNR